MSTKESKEHFSGDYLAVWRVTYDHGVRLVHSEMNEVVTDGWKRGQSNYDVVAVTAELAEAAFIKEYGRRMQYKEDDNYGVKKLSGPEFICYVDAAAVGDQAEQVQSALAHASVRHGRKQHGMREELAVLDHQVNARDVHVNDAPRANIEMSNFAIAHLPLVDAQRVH